MGKTTDVYWTGTYLMKDDTEAEFRAYGTYYYSPGCMYRRNGDPGDPPEEEIDVKKIYVDSLVDVDGKSVSLTEEKLKELEGDIEEAITDGDFEMQYREDLYE